MEDKVKILIWGAGEDCKRNIIFIPPEWEILAIIDFDLNKKSYCLGDTQIKIISPDKIWNYKYDFIVIMTSAYEKEIFLALMDMKISATKIIFGCRNKIHNATMEGNQKFFWEQAIQKKRQMDSEYKFEDQKKNHKRLFYVLAGYKAELWNDIFGRMKLFIPVNTDVCILSSGTYSEGLSRIASANGWSYLSTKVNDVAIIQNIVISLFPEAEMIYKMDEDVYITKDCCKKMEDIYYKIKQENKFDIGMIGPMIPLHTNGFLFLKRFQLEKAYQEETGYASVWGGRWKNPEYASDPKIPEFLWSQGNIDDLNRKLSDSESEYYITPVKYAICFVLFSRKLYEEMGGFLVNRECSSFGINGDEGQIANFCMQHCYMNIVALNTLCGHFCYPPQKEAMLQFRNQNYYYFEIRKDHKKRVLLENLVDNENIENSDLLKYIKYQELEEYIDLLDKDRAVQVMKNLFKANCKNYSNKQIVKIGFIVYSSAEWQCEELYWMLYNDQRFETGIFIAKYPYGSLDIIEEKYRETCKYFEQRKYNIYYTYNIEDTEDRLNRIDDFDILVYFTPFEMLSKKWNIRKRSLSQLCIHIPYAYYLVSKEDAVYSDVFYEKPVFKLAWFYFASCKLQAEIASKKQRLEGYNIKASGFPKMDLLIENKYNVRDRLWKTNDKTKLKVIWAPHFNMKKGMNGTFHENYIWFLEFAKEHQEVAWVVRPHPRMERGVLEQGVFQTEGEYKEYLKQWDDLSNARVIPSGDYYDIFAYSDAMILDCVSFLAEYQFTGKPLLLLQPECKRALSELGEKLVSVLYTARGDDFQAIQRFLDETMIGIDPRKNERMYFWDEYLNYAGLNKKTATEYIYDTILDEIFGM